MSEEAERLQSFISYLSLKLQTDAMYSFSRQGKCFTRVDFGALNYIYVSILDDFTEKKESMDDFFDKCGGSPERRRNSFYFLVLTEDSLADVGPQLEICKNFQNTADKSGIIYDIIVYSCKDRRYVVIRGSKVPDKKFRKVLDNAAFFFDVPEEKQGSVIRSEVDKTRDIRRRMFYTGPRVGPNPVIFLIVANILFFIAQLVVEYRTGQDYFTAWGIQDNELILQGEIWRLVTSMFLHSGAAHLCGNMMFLFWIGRALYPHYSNGQLWLIYFVSGLAGNLLGLVFSDYLSLGASGAIMGLGGALLYKMIFDRDGKRFRFLGNFVSLALAVIFNLVLGLVTPGIDNYGHFGGFAGGFFCAMIIAKALSRRTKTEE